VVVFGGAVGSLVRRVNRGCFEDGDRVEIG
jgi:hypothetical protein